MGASASAGGAADDATSRGSAGGDAPSSKAAADTAADDDAAAVTAGEVKAPPPPAGEVLEGAFDASLLSGLEGALDRDWDRLEASFFSAVEGAEKAKEQEAAQEPQVEIPRAPVPIPVRSFGGGGQAAGADAGGEGAAAAASGDSPPPGADGVVPGVLAAEDAAAAGGGAPDGGAGAAAGGVAAAAAAADPPPKAKRGRKKKAPAPTLLAQTAAAAAAAAGDAPAPGANVAGDPAGGEELGLAAEQDMFLETANEHRWYSLQVKPGTENSVRIALQNMCVAFPRLAKQLRHVLVPAVAVQCLTKAGKRVTREERLFPGYMLVCMAMDRQSYQDVRGVTHVQGFMGDPNREKRKKDPMRPPDAISPAAIAEVNAKLVAAKAARPPPPGGGVAAAMGYAPFDPAAAELAKAAAAAGGGAAAAAPAAPAAGGATADAASAGAGAPSGGGGADARVPPAPPADRQGLQAGDTVRIVKGAHAGECGVLSQVNPATATVRVTLDIFGVATPVDVAAADVVREAAPAAPLEDDPEFGLGLADL